MRAQLLQPKTIMYGIIAQVLLITAFLVLTAPKAHAAACSTTNTFGTVTFDGAPGTPNAKVDITSTATYRVWSRIAVPDTTNNSYMLEITSSTGVQTCLDIGGNAAIPVTTDMATKVAGNQALNWQWINYKDGNTGTFADMPNLAAGLYTIKLIGSEASVAVDRVVFTSDLSCTPLDKGDNCANPPDTTPPVVSISSPTSGASIPGNNTNTAVNVTATDDVAIARVEFYIDNVLTGAPDTTSPYGFTLNASTLTPGPHTLRARAYDTSATGNPTNSANVSITVTDATAPTSVTFTAPTATTIAGSVTVTATAQDNVGIQRIDFFLDNGTTPLFSDTTPPYSFSLNTTGTNPVIANGAHTLRATAFDAANNSTSVTKNIDVQNPVVPPPDTTAPTVSVTNPIAGAEVKGNPYKMTANATDTSGIKQVEFFIDGASKNVDTVAPYEYSFDSNTIQPNGNHTFGARATDNSPNANVSTTATVTANVNNFVFWDEDINMDRNVGPFDFIIFKADYGKCGSALSNQRSNIDKSTDGCVGPFDFIKFKAKYGQSY